MEREMMLTTHVTFTHTSSNSAKGRDRNTFFLLNIPDVLNKLSINTALHIERDMMLTTQVTLTHTSSNSAKGNYDLNNPSSCTAHSRCTQISINDINIWHFIKQTGCLTENPCMVFSYITGVVSCWAVNYNSYSVGDKIAINSTYGVIGMSQERT